MNGVSLARAIKSDAAIADTRLIMLTARGQQLSEEEMQKAGISQCRFKPVQQSMLFDCLSTVMDEAQGNQAEAPATTPSVVSHKERVLLAEDNLVNQRVALGQLRKLGYEVDAVVNGVECLAALEAATYDIVLMDCEMPEMDGYEAVAAIRAREGTEKHTWVIAMTANAMHEDRVRCLNAGMDDYLSKPVRLDDLSTTLERAQITQK